jgi:hypothetical protein
LPLWKSATQQVWKTCATTSGFSDPMPLRQIKLDLTEKSAFIGESAVTKRGKIKVNKTKK